ncbi:MAG: hypothetical protein ACI4RT_08045 [Candidatus Spyradenecus sp.]
MDFTKPINARGEGKPRRWGLRVAMGTLGVLGVLVLLVAMAPWILSCAWARTLILRKANEALAPARVEVASWRLSWFGAQQVEGIGYHAPAQGVEAQIKALQLNSLWQLLPIGRMRAEVTIDAPEVTLTPVAKASKPAPEAVVPSAPVAKKPLSLPITHLSARLTVREAKVRHASLAEPLLEAGTLTVNWPEETAPVTLDFSGKALGAQTVLRALSRPPAELLAAPQRALQDLTLSLSAPWGEVAAQAVGHAAGPWPEARVKLRMNLCALWAQAQQVATAFGVSLELPEGYAITGGTLEAQGSLLPDATQEHLSVNLKASTPGLRAQVAGQPLDLAPEVVLAARVVPEKPLTSVVEAFTIKLPGLSASGHGSLETGTFNLQAESTELLAAARPFVGEVPLAEPLTLSAELTGKREQVEAQFALRRLQAPAGTANLLKAHMKVEEPDLVQRAFRNASLALEADLTQALRFAPPLPEGQSAGGELRLNATAAGNLENLRAKVIAAVRNATFTSAAWQVNEAELARLEATLAYTAGSLAAEALTLTTPCLTAEGQATLAPEKPFPKAALSGSFKPSALLAWRKWGKGEMPMTAQGRLDYALKTTPEQRVEAQVRSADFALTLPNQPTLALPFTLSAAASLGERITLEQLTLDQALLSLTARGTYAPAEQLLTLEGTLTPDFAALWALPFCDPYRELGLAVRGRHATPFTFRAPLVSGVPGILNEGRAQAELRFDKITCPGLDIPGGSAAFTLAEGVAAMDGTWQVNGGRLNLRPQVNLSATPYVLTLPEGSLLLDQVQVTPELLDLALRAVSPILPGSAEPQGTLSLRVEALRLPLGGDVAPLAALEAQIAFLTHGVALKPNGTLGTVLSLLQVRDRVLAMPDQNFGVAVSGGKLTCDEIHLRVSGVKLRCAGASNLLTREVNYTLSMPLTAQLLGSRLSKKLPVGQTLSLPISGSIDKPKVETGPILTLLKESAISRASQKVSQRLTKALQKTGEAGLEVGGAAGDVAGEALNALGSGADEAKEKLKNTVDDLFNRWRRD